ncbi:MAG: tRNA (adenosine(37)-N6)-threonylcarbamoyltransferase complex dimerization subunit type 1 TsaB [Acidiferrobacterales bacterium]
MKLLALDTSTAACSVALWDDGRVCEHFESGEQHSHRILPMIEALLGEAGLRLGNLDALALGRGPGSFTGLRIGAAVVQGLGFAADLPVVPVSSLAALAQAQEQPRVLAAIDARMNQVYWGVYVRDGQSRPRLAGSEIVSAPADLPGPQERGWWGAGSGWDLYADRFQARWPEQVSGWSPQCFPHARDVAILGAAGFAAGEALPAERALPVYVRDDVATKKSADR